MGGIKSKEDTPSVFEYFVISGVSNTGNDSFEMTHGSDSFQMGSESKAFLSVENVHRENGDYHECFFRR